jgi:HEAT repeat protein
MRYEPMSIAARIAQIRSEQDHFIRERLAGYLIDDVERTPPPAIEEAAIDQIINLLNDDSDAVRGRIAMAIGAIGPRAQRATPTLENALELARQYITYIQERNFVNSGFPIFTGTSSATDMCMALKDIGAPSPPDCFDGWYGEPVVIVPGTSSKGP